MSNRRPSERTHLARGVVILHEDRDILVVDKPAGLLTVGTDSGQSLTAYSIVTNYVRKGNPRSRDRVFIVHRLDRDTSGVLVFAKREAVKIRLQDDWHEVHKKYLAIVHGTCRRTSDTIRSYLAENKAQRVYSTADPAEGKLSQTAYRVLRQTKSLALLEIDLLTGRKNQIRVHLADIGHPIVGDRKYGRTDDRFPDLALHAYRLSFKHPHSGQELSFAAKIPTQFAKLVGKFAPEDATSGGTILLP
jgi:tRNA pseudouridine32 synthase/23S rRNA pseudouridine746 synthase/23S rRNA pseudouridine1911/1915/1917 synthase